MLRRVGETVDSKDAVVKIKDASFPTPFVSALEYNSPVHGNWNIVHTGMQVPESIQIYVCADNCMRGVVLTAAEMNAADRFSFVLVEEQNLRVLPRGASGEVLAIGQKAAYFGRSRHFVNLVQGEGLYGFDGIRRTAELMMDAYLNEKDTEKLVVQKGWGCECCL